MRTLKIKQSTFLTFAYFVCALLSHEGHADQRSETIRKKLQDFQSNTADFMRKTPEKTTDDGQSLVPRPISEGTSTYDLINREMDRLGKSTVRPFDLRSNSPAPVSSQDNAANLVDQLKMKTLDSMDSAQLLSSQLQQHPWSSTYWPLANGVIAWRYSDPSFPDDFDWKKASDYLLDPHNSCSVDELSPAEKYDLLVGDSSGSMMHAMLKEGQPYYDADGSVESWMGICHGWAPASYMEPRPRKAINLTAADGQSKIQFYPSDIKALSSLLWANGQFQNRFIGQRCNNPNPPTDANGRSTDPACNGENPGTWHLSVVNQIGSAQRSFVMDALHDTQIWNQPVYGYHYTYFNPQTSAPVDSLDQATIEITKFSSDKFKSYRSSKTRFVVGIAMDLTYVSETTPSTSPIDGPANDSLVTVHYLYDLELGSDKSIIGGEWYTNSHPGFLWTPTPDAQAISVGDEALSSSDGNWDGSDAIPTSWSNAIRTSSEQGQPLAKIVNILEILANLQ